MTDMSPPAYPVETSAATGRTAKPGAGATLCRASRNRSEWSDSKAGRLFDLVQLETGRRSVAFGLPSVLAQRAASEGPRWTRAVEGSPIRRSKRGGREELMQLLEE